MKYILLFLLLFANSRTQAQQPAGTPGETKLTPVLDAGLTDKALRHYRVQSMTLYLPAGYHDTIAHRHDADLFGYVTEGRVVIGLQGRAPATYGQGQMFHEARNILHRTLENPDTLHPAVILLFYVIRNGRNRYHKA